MISYELHKRIEKEGKEKGYKIREAYGTRDEDGYFSFIIRLVPTDEHAKPSPSDLSISVSDGLETKDEVR